MLFDKLKCQLIADQLLYLRYEREGRGENGTVDCFGLIVLFFRRLGIEIADYSGVENWGKREGEYLDHYAGMSRLLAADENPGPGDIVLFENTEDGLHAGVIIGDGLFLHVYKKIGAKIDRLNSRQWKKTARKFYRLTQ